MSGTVRRFLSLLIGLPVCIAIVALAVANRRPVALSFDPFSAATSGLNVQVPLFAIIFASLIVGVVLGGVAVWFGQHRFRKEARSSRKAAPPPAPRGPALPAPVRRA